MISFLVLSLRNCDLLSSRVGKTYQWVQLRDLDEEIILYFSGSLLVVRKQLISHCKGEGKEPGKELETDKDTKAWIPGSLFWRWRK